MCSECIRNAKEVIHISTRFPASCKFGCSEAFVDFEDFKIDKLVNHYISKHEFQLLHVGQGGYTDSEDVLIHSTDYVVGKF